MEKRYQELEQLITKIIRTLLLDIKYHQRLKLNRENNSPLKSDCGFNSCSSSQNILTKFQIQDWM